MGVGPRRHMAGLAGIDDEVEAREGPFVLERRSGGTWTEVERTASRQEAETALDELAADENVDLGDLRVRELD
jgi:hypothetical protein